MIVALLVAGAAVVYALGYGAGRVRPLSRLDDWAWDQLDRRRRDLRDGPTRRRPGWYVAQGVFAVELVPVLVAHPRRTVHQWRHRNDPPPPRGPAPAIDPEWAAKRRAAAEGG